MRSPTAKSTGIVCVYGSNLNSGEFTFLETEMVTSAVALWLGVKLSYTITLN